MKAFANYILKTIYGKIQEKGWMDVAFEKTLLPIKNKDNILIYALQILIIILWWKRVQKVINDLISLMNGFEFLSQFEEGGELLLTGATVLAIFLMSFVGIKLGEYCTDTKRWFFQGIPILYEYNTIYHRRFLKECFKPLRKILGYFIGLLLYNEIRCCLSLKGRDEFEVDSIVFIYLVYLVKQMFSGYTKTEYEAKLKRIPRSVRKGGHKIYTNSLAADDISDALLAKENFCNHLPEVYEKTEFGSPEEEFLYRNIHNTDHLELMTRLLHGESVMTDTPFYLDMGVALFLPLHNALLQGKKIIFFSGGNEDCEEILDWINCGLKSVTRMDECWKVMLFGERDKDWDIGIITMDDLTMFYETKELMENPTGFIIVFIHPSKLLLEAQNELYEWGYLLSLEQIKPIYVIIERAMLGLLDLASHIFRTEFKYVSRAADPAGVSSVYVLDAGRRDIYEKKMNMMPMIGMGGMAAALAGNAGLENIQWMIGDKKPFYDINSIIEQHATLISEVGKKKSNNDKIKLVKCRSGLWGLEKVSSLFLVIEDDINNLLELVRQMETRGISYSLITVISERYLLLPFMIDNMKLLLNDIYAISAMTTSFSETSINRSVVLMKILLYRGMSAKEIKIYRSRYKSLEEISDEKTLTKDEEEKIVNEIRQCVGENIEIRLERKYNQNDEKAYTYYLKGNREIIKICKELTTPAVYFDEEEKKKIFLGGKHFWQVEQEYLPGQITAFNGKLYQIIGLGEVRIDDEMEQVLRVRRYREGVIYYPQYYQDRVYCLNEKLVIDKYEQIKYGIYWGRFSVPYTVKTEGYYIVENAEEKDRIEYVALNGKYERNHTIDCQGRKNAIAMKFDNWGSKWQEKEVFVIILTEVLKTLFPEGYQYIAVLAVLDNIDKPSALQHLYYRMENNFGDGNYSFLILEDSKLELGILSMIYQHMEHILRIAYSYCCWWKDKYKESHNKISFWATEEWQNAMGEAEGFIEMLDKKSFGELTAHRQNKVSQDGNGKSNWCWRCWEPVSNKKKICDNCLNSDITKEDYEKLFEYACFQLAFLFGIEINFPIDIKVKNMKERKRVFIRSSRGKLYCSSKVQLHAALLNLIRQLIIIWEENALPKKLEIGGVMYNKYMKYAIADWYEMCFAKMFSLEEYVANKNQWLKAGKGKEKKYYRELLETYNFNSSTKKKPLDDFLNK